MGQGVQEVEPVFLGAHEGLCLCSSRLLFPLWELPVVAVKGGLGLTDAFSKNGLVVCKLSVGAMQVLEIKIRCLEKFLRTNPAKVVDKEQSALDATAIETKQRLWRKNRVTQQNHYGPLIFG
ncbi:hypothetical protein CMV_012128 [Castanea mollissima]|uniref:Uncharacterized protein n=1 Tax=Castanea mollissima TaxID=60419 RepID=A0A8J4VNJ4_9ROSI|nr:hypothetical protein CMV_012128 [Castanea mollissima]